MEFLTPTSWSWGFPMSPTQIETLLPYQLLPKSTQKVLDESAKGTLYAKVERATMGVHHAELGSCLCERWKLPSLVVASARSHLASREVLEEASIPRGALVVTATCRLTKASLPEQNAQGWSELIQVPLTRLKVILAEAATFAKACREKVFTL